MNYYIMQTSLARGAKPQLVHWAKTQADAIDFINQQLALWRETGVANPPIYEVHYSGFRNKTALWSSLD